MYWTFEEILLIIFKSLFSIQIIKNQLINQVKRNNKDLGQYIAGKLSGLTYLRKVGNG